MALLLRGDRLSEEEEVLAEDLLEERTGDLLPFFLPCPWRCLEPADEVKLQHLQPWAHITKAAPKNNKPTTSMTVRLDNNEVMFSVPKAWAWAEKKVRRETMEIIEF